MIVDKIEQYLEGGKRTLDDEVADAFASDCRASFIRQFMEDRKEKREHFYTTMATIGCARKSWYTYHGTKREPLQARAITNFMFGDVSEAVLSRLGRLAGCKLTLHNEKILVPIPGMDGRFITCIPDDLLEDENGGFWNVEYKSMNSFGFDRFKEEEMPDNTFGYLAQTAMEEYAWRTVKKIPVKGSLMVASKKETGHLAESKYVSPKNLVDEIFERCHLAIEDEAPERGFKPIEEVVRKKSTGRLVLPLNCSYCDARPSCHPNVMMEVNSYGKPVWVLPKEVSSEASR